MWIIKCTELGTIRQFDVGPFGTDDQAEDAAEKLQAESHLSTDVQPLVEPGRALGRSDVLMAGPTTAEALREIARRISPCPIPDVANGWNLCAHGLPWPCPTTEAAWIARGLDRDEQVSAAQRWLRGEQAAAYAGATLEEGGH